MRTSETGSSLARREGRSSRVLIVLLAALAGLATGAAIVRLATVALGCDQASQLYATLQMLHGTPLYGTHLVEGYAPFIFWLLAIPGWISQHVHLSTIACFHAFVVAVLIVTSTWSAILYRRTRGGRLLCWWVFVLTLSALSAFLAVPDALGEREHLLAYFLLPYLLSVALRMEGTHLSGLHRLLIGVCAAVALCLVPQYLLVVIAVEVVVLLRKRQLSQWFDLSLLVMLVGVLFYAAIVRLLTPEYFKAVLPLLRETSWGLDRSILSVFAPAKKTLVLLVAGSVFYNIRQKRMANEAFVAVLLMASFASLLIFLGEHKGWVYQMMPFRTFSYLALTLFFADTVSDLLERRQEETESGSEAAPYPDSPTSLIKLSAAVAGVVLLLSLVFFARRNAHLPSEVSTVDTLRGVYAPYPAGTTVGFLSTDAWEFPAVLEQNKLWGSRYTALWTLPAIVRSADPQDTRPEQHLTPARSTQLAQQLRVTVAADLATFKPTVITVDPCGRINLCPALTREGYTSILDWFKADAAFQAEWSHYQLVRTETDSTIEVYERRS